MIREPIPSGSAGRLFLPTTATADRRRKRLLSSATLAAMSFLSLNVSLKGAATFYTWDNSGTAGNSGTPQDGSGNWGSTGSGFTNWVNSSTTSGDVVWPNNATLDTAVIGDGGTAGTITIGPTTTIFANVNFGHVASGGYTITGGTLSTNGAIATFNLATGATPTISSTLNVTSALTITGAGTLTDNANMVAGATNNVIISGGATVAIPVLDNVGSDGVYPLGNSTIGAQTRLEGGTLQYTGPTGSWGHGVKVAAGSGTLDMEGSGVWTLTGFSNLVNSGTADTINLTGSSTSGNGAISTAINNTTTGNFAASVVKLGANTWTLSGTNLYTGSTSINGGTLSASSIADSAAINLNASNANSALVLTSATALGAGADIYVTTSASFASKIYLNFSGNDTVFDLVINGVALAPGSYGAFGSDTNPSNGDGGSLFGSGDNGTLLVTNTPEPGELSILLLGSGALLRRRRRQVQHANSYSISTGR